MGGAPPIILIGGGIAIPIGRAPMGGPADPRGSLRIIIDFFGGGPPRILDGPADSEGAILTEGQCDASGGPLPP